MKHMKQIFNRIAGCWCFVSDLYRLFEPARFSIILIGISLLVFFNVDQGVEVLRSLAEGDLQDGKLRWAQQGFFFGALFYWSWQSWYWPRTLLEFRFPSTPADERLKEQSFRFLIRHGPRILGVLPELIIGLACWRASAAYQEEGPRDHLRAMGAVAWAGGVLLYVLFFVRRWLIGALHSDKPNASRFTSRRQLFRSTKWVLRVSLGFGADSGSGFYPMAGAKCDQARAGGDPAHGRGGMGMLWESARVRGKSLSVPGNLRAGSVGGDLEFS